MHRSDKLIEERMKRIKEKTEKMKKKLRARWGDRVDRGELKRVESKMEEAVAEMMDVAKPIEEIEEIKPKTYYCSKCEHNHSFSSGIGKEHKEFAE